MTRFIPFFAALFIRALHATLRVRYINFEILESFHRSGGHYIIAFWHCHILMMLYCRFERPACVMISQHRDGELIARTIERFDVGTARGSSTRGGFAALREMIRIAATGTSLGITPDGPRGPRCVAQVGVVTAAQMTGFPVIPVAFIAEHKRRLRSWDRFEVPRPFSRGMFVYGNPIPVPRELDAAGVEEYRARIERSMNDLVEAAELNFDAIWRARALPPTWPPTSAADIGLNLFRE
jgi:lysophospholipid acyltransferase (LPLAT)-like uncharacterized protein